MKTRQQNAAKEKALRERRTEFRLWKKWRHERLEAPLANPHYVGPMRALLECLKHTKTPGELIDIIRLGPWFGADAEVRFVVLALVDAAIMRKREQLDKAPFDDPLPGERDNVFFILREMLAPDSA
jgi:hypothetical protein